jgi:hypothetical protein
MCNVKNIRLFAYTIKLNNTSSEILILIYIEFVMLKLIYSNTLFFLTNYFFLRGNTKHATK